MRPGPAWRAAGALSARAVRAHARRPAQTLFPVLFPLFFAAVSAGAFSRATALPRFPEVDGFVDFAVAGTLTQGVLVGSLQAGVDAARDVRRGFLDRVLTSPVPRGALGGAHLVGAAAVGLVQSALLVGGLVAAGAEVRAGWAGAAVLVLYGALVAVALGGLMVAVGVTSGAPEVVQSLFPLVFIALFASSAFFPVALMEGWFATLAAANPVTPMVDAARRLVLEGWSTGAAARALGLAGLAATGGAGVARLALARRVARR